MKKSVLSSMIVCGLLSYSASYGMRDSNSNEDWMPCFSVTNFKDNRNVQIAFSALYWRLEGLSELEYFNFLNRENENWEDEIDTVTKSIRRRYQLVMLYGKYFSDSVTHGRLRIAER